ncbi:hypothetical protein AB3X91_18870 [Paraburkholderia sp. BR14263]|uniref:hypothetical protein n=1 Tax=unclassified Paraburkholderia TaxID=2615204 RepID=UPI0034CEB5CD
MFLILIMVAGGVGTLVTWPKADPTGTQKFWIQLLAIPFLLWAVGFGLRALYYEQESDRIDAESEVLRADREKALQFACDPLAVVGSAYLTGAGTGDVAAILAKETDAREALALGNETDVNGFSALPLIGDDEDPSRYRVCFQELIRSIANSVRTIPRDAPFSVKLQLPEDADKEALLNLWQACWHAEKLRVMKAGVIETDTGVMLLDEWLDVRGGPELEKFLLLAAARLHHTPEQGGSEAAVALLLSWAPLARRHYINPIALLHRPVEAEADNTDTALINALQWGRTTGDKVNHLWEAGLRSTDKAAIAKSMSGLASGVTQSENLSGIHDVDSILGHLGGATGWLAIALGIEHAANSNSPQLIAWREHLLRFAVVQPVGQTSTDATV